MVSQLESVKEGLGIDELTHKISLISDHIHLWKIYIKKCPYHIRTKWTKILSNEEKKRLNHFVFDDLKILFGTSHVLLRLILNRYINSCPEKIEYTYNQYGKPFLKENSEKIQFNMSHSKDYIFLGICKSLSIGVDIEQHSPIEIGEDIFDHVLTSNEKKYLKDKSAFEKKLLFLRAWTCKEAFVKALGKGLAFSMLDVELSLECFPPRLLSILGNKDVAKEWSLLCNEKREDFTTSVAIKNPHILHFRYVNSTEALHLLGIEH